MCWFSPVGIVYPQEKETIKKKHEKLDDYRLFMYCCVAAVVIWTWWASYMCWDMMDQLLMLLYALGLLLLPFVVRRYRLLDK